MPGRLCTECGRLAPDEAVSCPECGEMLHAPAGVDAVVVTAGLFAGQEELEADPGLTARLLAADFTNTVLFCEEACAQLQGGEVDTISAKFGCPTIPVE